MTRGPKCPFLNPNLMLIFSPHEREGLLIYRAMVTFHDDKQKLKQTTGYLLHISGDSTHVLLHSSSAVLGS